MAQLPGFQKVFLSRTSVKPWKKKLPRHTLQHLARLVEQERLAIDGRGRGSRDSYCGCGDACRDENLTG
jgi:hypothetical protein